MLKVRVAEMQRQIAKQFGVNLSEAAMVAGVPVIASTGNQFDLLGRALSDASGAPFGSVCPGAFLPGRLSRNIVGTGAYRKQTGSTTSPRRPHAPVPNNLQGVVQALDQVGLMHTLAEPNLTAVSGETRGSSPAVNSPFLRAATSRATSRSSSSSSASVCRLRRWC